MSLESGSTGATSTSTAETKPEIHEKKMIGRATSPGGSLTLLNRDGTPRGLINAAEITAFRTALVALMLFKKRKNVHDVVIFGTFKRIAILLQPH